jgi:hypothetical protein
MESARAYFGEVLVVVLTAGRQNDTQKVADVNEDAVAAEVLVYINDVYPLPHHFHSVSTSDVSILFPHLFHPPLTPFVLIAQGKSKYSSTDPYMHTGDPDIPLDEYGRTLSPLGKLALTQGTNKTPRMIAGHSINIVSYCSSWYSHEPS